MSWVESVTLKNYYCTLAPLLLGHRDDLVASAKDGELWNLKYATIPQPNKMEAEIKRRLKLLDKAEMIPFAVIHNESQKVVGMTTYCKIDRPRENWILAGHGMLKVTSGLRLIRIVSCYF